MTFEEMSMQEANAVKNRLARKRDSKEEQSTLLETSIKTNIESGHGGLSRNQDLVDEESIKESVD